MVKITLTAPHIHAGVMYPAGSTITVNQSAANYITGVGVGRVAGQPRRKENTIPTQKENENGTK